MGSRADIISVHSPCVNLTGHMLKGRHGLRQSLLGKNAGFYFGYALCDLLGRGRLKGFIQRSNRVDETAEKSV